MKPVQFKSAAWAGIIAGIVFMALEMIMVPSFLDASIFNYPRRIAAIALGTDVLSPPNFFTLGVFIIATGMHFIFSFVFGMAIAFTINLFKLSLTTSIVFGAVLGYLLYILNFYVITNFFPWFVESRNWVSAFTHISFGIALTWSYLGLLKIHDRKTHKVYQK